MKKLSLSLFILFLSLMMLETSFAQYPNREDVIWAKMVPAGTITLDGNLNEAVWNNAVSVISDSVEISDEEIQYYMNKINYDDDKKTVTLINIIEIYNKDLDKMMILLDELTKGTDFIELAKRYNQREYTKKSNGEWGYFSANVGGEIGKIASNLKVGQIYGPIKVKDGYSIIKLIDRKEISNSLIKISEEPKDYIKMKLSLNKINLKINRYTAFLAKKFGVEINFSLLDKTELSQLNMFTYRLIGFGGKIAAMPITIPIFEWYYLYNKQKEIP